MEKQALFKTIISKASARIQKDSDKPLDADLLHKITKRTLGKHEKTKYEKLAEKQRADKVVDRVLATYAKFEQISVTETKLN